MTTTVFFSTFTFPAFARGALIHQFSLKAFCDRSPHRSMQLVAVGDQPDRIGTRKQREQVGGETRNGKSNNRRRRRQRNERSLAEEQATGKVCLSVCLPACGASRGAPKCRSGPTRMQMFAVARSGHSGSFDGDTNVLSVGRNRADPSSSPIDEKLEIIWRFKLFRLAFLLFETLKLAMFELRQTFTLIVVVVFFFVALCCWPSLVCSL